jgi:hypothetical protein
MKDLVDGYIARYGRAPSRAHVWALHEQAFRSGRKPKDEELVSPAEQLARWEAKAAEHRVQALASIPGAVALYAAEHGATGGAVARLGDDARHRAIRIAVAEVQRQNASDVSVIEEYKQRGRIYDGRRDDMYDRAVRNWLGDFLAGKDTLLLAGSNEEAAELAGNARRQLIRPGRVRNSGDITLRDSNDASVGELLRARQNSKIPAAGKPLENRDVVRLVSWWTAGIRRQAIMQRQLADGRWSQQFLVPGDYIAEHCEVHLHSSARIARARSHVRFLTVLGAKRERGSAQVRPDAVSMTLPSLLTWRDTAEKRLCAAVRSVRDEVRPGCRFSQRSAYPVNGGCFAAAARRRPSSIQREMSAVSAPAVAAGPSRSSIASASQMSRRGFASTGAGHCASGSGS